MSNENEQVEVTPQEEVVETTTTEDGVQSVENTTDYSEETTEEVADPETEAVPA